MPNNQGREDTQPIPTSDLETAKHATTNAVWRLNVRYILLTVGLNAVVAAGVVTYGIYNDQDNTRVFLTDIASHAANAAKVLRERRTLTSREVIDEASELTACEMALINASGQVFYGSHDEMGHRVHSLGWPKADTPLHSTQILVDGRLGDLSGLWWLGAFNDRYRLLVVVPRRPEDEGRLQYMSFAAGITGAGVLVTLAIMLIASNWLLRRPLVRLIDSLTRALVRDVKRRESAEERAIEARLEAEHHLRFLDNLLNASDEVAIVATNPDGRIRLVNRVAERITGVSANHLVDTLTLDQLMVSLQPRGGGIQDTLQPFLQHTDGEQPIVDSHGRERIIQVTSSAIRDSDGAPGGTVLIFTDITEQRRVEAELRSKQMQLIQSSRMATLGEMAAGVAHELNQPLNNIGLLAARANRRLARKATLDDQDALFLREKLGTMSEQVRRAAKIIDHLRVFGRADPAPLEALDPAAAIRGALELLGEQLRLHDVLLEVEVEDQLPRAVGDTSRLEQVLINLIINARHALDDHAEALQEEGEVVEKRLSIRVRQGELRMGEPGVLIEVEDNGPGMSEEVAERVFEPFFTTKDVGKGTGLGLSISYGIVREFGGTLTVETAPGQGATFTVTLRQTEEAMK